MRARVLAVVAALAVLASACGVVSASAAAVVGGTRVPMDEFSRLVQARIQGLGLEGTDLRLAEQGRELGLLSADRIRQGVGQAIQDGDMGQGDLPELPDPVVDELFASAREAVGDDYEPALEELGVDEQTWQEVYGRAAERLVAGILYFGQQQPPTIPLDRADYLRQVQSVTLSELITAELARQQFDALGLELDQDEIDQQREAIMSGFETQEEFEAVRLQAGRGYPTMEDFDELIVRTQLRRQILQQPDNAEQAQRAREQIDIEVPGRFGTWNPEQGRVVAPEV